MVENILKYLFYLCRVHGRRPGLPALPVGSQPSLRPARSHWEHQGQGQRYPRHTGATGEERPHEDSNTYTFHPEEGAIDFEGIIYLLMSLPYLVLLRDPVMLNSTQRWTWSPALSRNSERGSRPSTSLTVTSTASTRPSRWGTFRDASEATRWFPRVVSHSSAPPSVRLLSGWTSRSLLVRLLLEREEDPGVDRPARWRSVSSGSHALRGSMSPRCLQIQVI